MSPYDMKKNNSPLENIWRVLIFSPKFTQITTKILLWHILLQNSFVLFHTVATFNEGPGFSNN